MNNKSLEDRITQELEARLKRFQANPLPKSTLAFGVHKGGSTMLHNFLRIYIQSLNPDQRVSSINIPTVLFRELGLTDSQFDKLGAIPRLIMAEHGRCYYGWRNIPLSFMRFKSILSHFPAVALIRDPRDCAVSAYFSFLGSHKLPRDKDSPAAQSILEERCQSSDKGIDQWVTENINRFTTELTRIAAFLHPDLRLYRYEDIWEHKKSFFFEVVSHLTLPYSEDAFATAYGKVNIVPGKDPSGHVRKGTPGDHREKLREKTQNHINTQYRNLLELFNYT